MDGVKERFVNVNGNEYRVWEKGEGRPIGFFPGLGGLPKWPLMLDRLAETHRVIAPSLPGFPGGAKAHLGLDSQLDWVLEVEGLYSASGLAGADLIGVSVGGALAAEVAAVWPDKVRRLVLVAPFGLFDEQEPVSDVFALAPGDLASVVCAEKSTFESHTAAPEGREEEGHIEQVRAAEAAARLLWPLSDTRLSKRLGRITQSTLLLWGGKDQIIPPGYAGKFQDGIAGKTRVEVLPEAGHLVDLDAPEDVARIVAGFLE